MTWTWPWEVRKPRAAPPSAAEDDAEQKLEEAHRKLEETTQKTSESNEALQQIADDIKHIRVRVHAIASGSRPGVKSRQ